MSDDNQKYPNSTAGIAGLLNITPHGDKAPTSDETDTSEELNQNSEANSEASSMFAEKSVAPPANLPFAETEEDLPKDVSSEPVVKPSKEVTPAKTETMKDILHTDTVDFPKLEPVGSSNGSKSVFTNTLENGPRRSIWGIVKKVLPYVVIFAIGIGLYFFYFNDFSFNSLFNSSTLKLESVTNSNTNKEYDQLKKDAEADYKVWFSQFFTDVNDDSISSMDADVSGNGLTNFEKYLLNLNPKVYSTRGGTGDGESVLQGVNPWTGKTFTDKQKKLVEKYLNPELISNRITAAAITRGVTKYAQYVSPDSPYYIDPATLAKVGSNNQVVVSPTQISSTTPANIPTNTQTNSNSNSNLRPDEGIDQSKPATLTIPANNITVPLTWTKDVKDFETDLRNGVVHYPGTALPGEVGTSYISGHSSGYVWDKSPYKQIFAGLGNVKDGTSFTITATQINGKTIKFNYVIDHRGEFAANDQAQFISTADSVVALSTCWPVGTTARRLVLFGKLTQIEKS